MTTTGVKTGFASLTPEQRVEMAKRGNAASRAAGNNGFTPETSLIASAIARSNRKAPPATSGGAPAQAQ